MCYKDMTFCTYYTSCLNPYSRALTEEVRLAAEKWMKNALICQFSEKPSCYSSLEDHIGEILQFEYWSEITGWTYDEDVISSDLIEASKNFRYMKILRDDS